MKLVNRMCIWLDNWSVQRPGLCAAYWKQIMMIISTIYKPPCCPKFVFLFWKSYLIFDISVSVIIRKAARDKRGLKGKDRGVATDFWVGGRIVGMWLTYPPKYPKNRKRHRISATSFSNLEGTSHPKFVTGGRVPLRPPAFDAHGKGTPLVPSNSKSVSKNSSLGKVKVE